MSLKRADFSSSTIQQILLILPCYYIAIPLTPLGTPTSVSGVTLQERFLRRKLQSYRLVYRNTRAKKHLSSQMASWRDFSACYVAYIV